MLQRWFLLLGVFLIICFPVYGFQIDFLKDTFDSLGFGRTRSLTITNKGADILAVELEIVPREIDIEGQETTGASSPDFDIYPAQLLINPGEDANVNLVWKGTQSLSQELAYRVVTKEIPFHGASEFKSGPIQLVVGRQFMHAAYVAPPAVAPKIGLQSLTVSENGTARDLVVVVENTGTAHKIVSGFSVMITDLVATGGTARPIEKEIEINAAQFSQKINLLPGGRRRFVVPWPENLPKMALKGRLVNVQ